MAKSNRNTRETINQNAKALNVDPDSVGLRATKNSYGGVTHRGSREAIIAAGLASPEQIPGDPQCPRRARFCFERDDRRHVVTVSRGGSVVKVYIAPTHDEYEVMWERRRLENEARRTAEEASKSIAYLPRSRDEYEKCVRAFASASGRAFLLSSFGGFSLREQAVNEFEQVVDMAIDELLEHAAFSRAARDRQIAGLRQEAAIADPNFARFMSAAIGN